MKGSEHAQEKLKQREAEWDEAKQDWDAARRELQEARHRYSKKLLTDEDTSKLVRYLEMAQKQYEDAKMHYKEAKERYLIARDNSQQTSREEGETTSTEPLQLHWQSMSEIPRVAYDRMQSEEQLRGGQNISAHLQGSVLSEQRYSKTAKQKCISFVSKNLRRGVKLLLTIPGIILVSAGCFYAAEYKANNQIGDFGDAFYFTVVMVSTVGFGDIVPVTAAGRWVIVLTVMAEILVVPWLASLFASNVTITCPNCKLTGHDSNAVHCKACGNVLMHESSGP